MILTISTLTVAAVNVLAFLVGFTALYLLNKEDAEEQEE